MLTFSNLNSSSYAKSWKVATSFASAALLAGGNQVGSSEGPCASFPSWRSHSLSFHSRLSAVHLFLCFHLRKREDNRTS